MERFAILLHHRGRFTRTKKGTKYEDGEVTEWEIDEDYWSYFECLGELKELGYPSVSRMWYSIGGKSLDVGMKEFKDDKGAMEMKSLS